MPAGRGGTKRSGRNDRKPRSHTDKMGDITMGSTAPIRPRGGNGISKSSGPTRKKDLLNPSNRRTILQHAAGADATMRDPGHQMKGLVELKLTGWTKSKASTTSEDGGASALISWLEKKASNRIGVRAKSVKIKKVCCRKHADYRCDNRSAFVSSQFQNDDQRLQYGGPAYQP
nr:hypothetical protein CFP56_50406 [Quercus suber]